MYTLKSSVVNATRNFLTKQKKKVILIVFRQYWMSNYQKTLEILM